MKNNNYPQPPMRHLRVYAFDPQASTRPETASFNVAVIALRWEQEELDETLAPGPINAYLEVIDIDPVSGQFYDPIDLNDPLLLAQNGLPPSEGDPRFHQQMVFAVAMNTIRAFERALGRVVLWSPKWNPKGACYEGVDVCASIRMLCGSPTPTTVLKRKRCFLVISEAPPEPQV